MVAAVERSLEILVEMEIQMEVLVAAVARALLVEQDKQFLLHLIIQPLRDLDLRELDHHHTLMVVVAVLVQALLVLMVEMDMKQLF